MDEVDLSPLIPMTPELERRLEQTTPFAKAMGIKSVKLAPAFAVMKIAYQDKLVGNPATGVVHGGVVTAMLDHASGFAVFLALKQPTSIATLDLRIDYMRAAEPKRTIFAEAHCFKVTSSIAFVRGAAYHDSPQDPIATSVAAFMLDANIGRRPGANLK